MHGNFKDMRAVLFDVGGTLVHPDYLVIHRVLADFGLQEELGRIRATESAAKLATQQPNAVTPWKSFFGGWFRALGVPESDLAQLIDRVWQQHRSKNLWSEVTGDTVPTLRALQKGKFKLGVISNSDGTAESLLDGLKLAAYFDVIVDSKIIGARKPDAAIFRFALNTLNIEPRHALYIGDVYDADVVGATGAGLMAILFDPQMQSTERDCVRIQRLDEVLGLIDQFKLAITKPS